MISIFGTAIILFSDESFILDPSNEEKTFAAKSCPQLLFKRVCRGIWFVGNSVLAIHGAYFDPFILELCTILFFIGENQ